MTTKRFSALLDSIGLSNDMILAISRDTGVKMASMKSQLEQLLLLSPSMVMHPANGDSIDTATATAGFYVLGPGATLMGAPDDPRVAVAHSIRLEVIEQGISIHLSGWFTFTDEAEPIVGVWEYFSSGLTNSGEARWCFTGFKGEKAGIFPGQRVMGGENIVGE